MTIEEFDNEKWQSDMKCIFNKNIYNIVSVEFYTRRLEISGDDIYDGFMVSFKDVELINK